MGLAIPRIVAHDGLECCDERRALELTGRHPREARGELAAILGIGTIHCGLRIADCGLGLGLGSGAVAERAQAISRLRLDLRGAIRRKTRPGVSGRTLVERLRNRLL